MGEALLIAMACVYLACRHADWLQDRVNRLFYDLNEIREGLCGLSNASQPEGDLWDRDLDA